MKKNILFIFGTSGFILLMMFLIIIEKMEVISNDIIENIEEIIEKQHYSYDSLMFFSEQYNRVEFEKADPQIFYIKNWNTPEFKAIKEESVGIRWDGKMFWGIELDKWVYTNSTYKAQSKRFIEEYGDSVCFIQKRFPRIGVSSDPRSTCWWLAHVKDLEDKKPYEQVKLLLCADDNFSKEIKEIVSEIQTMPGDSFEEKLINYTSEVIEQAPEYWDAWNYPGYYSDIRIEE